MPNLPIGSWLALFIANDSYQCNSSQYHDMKLFIFPIGCFKVARNEVENGRLRSALRIVIQEYGDRN